MKGKHYYKWDKTRRAYLAANPPNHQGYNVCYLCGKWIQENEITVDHIVPRSRAPDLRYTFSNLALACGSCNNAKGSKLVNTPKIDLPEDNELQGLW